MPEAVDDYAAAGNPVRFIDAVAGALDCAAAGFKRVKPKVTGRPGYAPGDLLKLYTYGYLNRLRSSRRLEAGCHRNIEVIAHLVQPFSKNYFCRVDSGSRSFGTKNPLLFAQPAWHKDMVPN